MNRSRGYEERANSEIYSEDAIGQNGLSALGLGVRTCSKTEGCGFNSSRAPLQLCGPAQSAARNSKTNSIPAGNAPARRNQKGRLGNRSSYQNILPVRNLVSKWL